MIVTYQTEPFSKFYADAKEMILAHWAEVGTFPDVRKLAVDEEKFLAADKCGMLVLITARDDGRLAGYMIGHVIATHHVSESKQAEQGYYYVDPGSRGRGMFSDLYREFEVESAKKSAVACRARQKLSNGRPNIPDSFFEKNGYVKTEVAWMKRL